MDAFVHIWGHHDWTGHASIEIGDKYYISFSPYKQFPSDDEEVIKGKHFKILFNKMRDDQKDRVLIRTIHLNFLRQDLIDDYLATKFEQEFPHYCLYDHNCSAVVARIIFAGAGASFDPHETLHGAWHSLSARFQRGPFFSHDDHERTTECIREHVEESLGLTARMALKYPLVRAIYLAVVAFDATTRLVWTPGAVEALANGMAEHNR